MSWLRRLLCSLRAHGDLTDVAFYSSRTMTARCRRCGKRFEW